MRQEIASFLANGCKMLQTIPRSASNHCRSCWMDRPSYWRLILIQTMRICRWGPFYSSKLWVDQNGSAHAIGTWNWALKVVDWKCFCCWCCWFTKLVVWNPVWSLRPEVAQGSFSLRNDCNASFAWIDKDASASSNQLPLHIDDIRMFFFNII